MLQGKQKRNEKGEGVAYLLKCRLAEVYIFGDLTYGLKRKESHVKRELFLSLANTAPQNVLQQSTHTSYKPQNDQED